MWKEVVVAYLTAIVHPHLLEAAKENYSTNLSQDSRE
jgi:hypothetical protein